MIMSSELEPQVNTVDEDDEDDKDDLFSECEINFTDREWQMIQQAGVRAELDAIKHFVTHVSVPSAAECEEAIKWNQSPGNTLSMQILSEFGPEQRDALEEMWKSSFQKDVVKATGDMVGDNNCKVMFQYAVNRIFRKLVYENKEHAKNRRIKYKTYVETIDVPMILCHINKTHICHVWRLE